MKEEPILYCLIRDCLDKYADIGIKTISYGKARWVLSRFNIRKDLQINVLKEMVDLGMLDRINKHALEIKWKSPVSERSYF